MRPDDIMDDPNEDPVPAVCDKEAEAREWLERYAGVAAPSPGNLRDYFAGQALPAIIAATSAGQHMPGKPGSGGTVAERMAADAYKLADAMLAEREKTGG